MEIYGYKVKINEDDEVDLANGTSPSSNFDYFLEALASIFIVLANDGWTVIFFNHYRAVNAALSICFFVVLLLIGQFILLNLFLAILLQNFDMDSVSEEIQKQQ